MAAAATLRTVLIVFVVVFCGRAACGVLPWHGRSDTASHLVRPSSCLLRLRGGNTSTDVSKAQGGGTHNKEENVVPLDEALKGHQELSEAMGLMTDLDKEIEAAQSKVMELEDSSGLTDEDRNRVRGILASKEMAAAESMQALPVMDRVHALEKIKNEIEAAIDKQMQDLAAMGAPAAEVGNFWETHVPVVDAEGFPRTDIPIEDVLKGRARLVELRNRYKKTMDRLQAALAEYFESGDGAGGALDTETGRERGQEASGDAEGI